jgi:hypothetical protein
MERLKILALFDVGEGEDARGFTENEFSAILKNVIETDASPLLEYRTPFGVIEEPLIIKTEKVPLLFGLMKKTKEAVLMELDNNYVARGVVWKGNSEECEDFHCLYSLPRYLLEEEDVCIELE